MTVPIVFWGATGQALVLRSFTESLGYHLVALFDNDPDVQPPFADVDLYIGPSGFDRWMSSGPQPDTRCLSAIGGAGGRDRIAIQGFMSDQGLRPITAVHPKAFVTDGVTLGPGCQILAGVTISAGVQIGAASIVNTGAIVDHESVLGDGVHIAPGATVTGCVTIGDFTMIGAAAVLLPGVTIGRDVIVGAGSVVTRDIPDATVAFGTPARVIRKNHTSEAIHVGPE